MAGRLARRIQTTADTTQLKSELPSSPSEPFNVQIHEDSFKTYNLEGPSLEATVTKDELLLMYRQMQTMRRMEMAADALYKAKLIRGFCHLAIGQEAVSVGMESGITTDDRVITGYRCHPFAVLRGGTIEGVIGELLGRQIGMSKGKGGSMHIFTPTFYGGNGIVGAQVPIGAGVAFAQSYARDVLKGLPNADGSPYTPGPPGSLIRGGGSCTFAMYGDGASNQGQVFEAFNMVRPFFYSFLVVSFSESSHPLAGETLEPPRHFHLRKQQVRHGHTCRTFFCQHRILHPWRQNPRSPSERYGHPRRSLGRQIRPQMGC